MRFAVYIFIISQLLNIIDVFADIFRKDSSGLNSIKWEKIEKNKSNVFGKIIWKSYNGEDGYFKNEDEETSTTENIKSNSEFKKYILNKKTKNYITEIEPFLPLNNFLNFGDLKTSVRWKSSFDGGVSGGTGQQNPSFLIDYGLSDSSLLSIYISGADDDLYNLVEGQKVNYYWQSYALSLKRKLIDKKESDLGLSIVSTIEYWRHASGSETSKSIFNQQDNAFGKDKFENIIGAISLPFSKNLNKEFTFFIVPGITFLPEELGEKGLGKNSYGNNFYLGSGFTLDIAQNVNSLFSYTIPLGPGHNYFDSNLNYSRKSVYSFGLGWDINPRIGIEGKITNSYGASPSTGLLTIPSDNKPLYTTNIIYRPYEVDTFLDDLNKRDKLISHGGITVSNALIPKSGTSQIDFNYDFKGNLFGSYSYSLSNIFQLEAINVGSFKEVKLAGNKKKDLNSTFLEKNNLNFRLGGKLLIFSPQKDDLLWLTLRTSIGRNDDTNQGYLFSELISTLRLNEQIAFNISPKYFLSGVKSFGGFGFSSYINLLDNVQLIPEINTSFNNDSDFNSTLALRYSYSPNKSLDLYYSNAPGIQDIGQLLTDNKYRFGVKLNFLY